MQIDINIDNFRMRSASRRQKIIHVIMNHYYTDRLKLNSHRKISAKWNETLIELLMDLIGCVSVCLVHRTAIVYERYEMYESESKLKPIATGTTAAVA